MVRRTLGRFTLERLSLGAATLSQCRLDADLMQSAKSYSLYCSSSPGPVVRSKAEHDEMLSPIDIKLGKEHDLCMCPTFFTANHGHILPPTWLAAAISATCVLEPVGKHLHLALIRLGFGQAHTASASSATPYPCLLSPPLSFVAQRFVDAITRRSIGTAVQDALREPQFQHPHREATFPGAMPSFRMKNSGAFIHAHSFAQCSQSLRTLKVVIQSQESAEKVRTAPAVSPSASTSPHLHSFNAYTPG